MSKPNSREIYQQGKNREKLVQKQLWSHGYQVKDVSSFSHYDLLVDKKIKVEVKYAKKGVSKYVLYWVILFLNMNEFDVLAIVLDDPINLFSRIYYLKEKESLPIIAKEPDAHYFQRLRLDVDIINEYFTTRPSEVLN